MARRGTAYPQVEPGAAGLMSRVVECAPRTPLARALDLARRHGARAVLAGRRAAARQADVERAVAWGLGARPVVDVAWTGLPVVAPDETEIAVRRLLADGAPMVLVRAGGRGVGVVDAASAVAARPALSIAHRLDDLGDARRWLLRVAAKAAESEGVSVRAVGGIVRDLLLGRPGDGVELVVEGDASAYARRLAAEIGGRLRACPRAGTVSIVGGASPDGDPLGRVDVATSHRVRYAAPGARPATRPGSLDEDLAQRDFTIDAMAVCLAPGEGRLVDLPGAQRDLRRRRLRPLHPLAFVEDPTRIFRAARGAARLGLRLDAMAVRGMRLALGVRAYPVLAGARLWAEVVETAAEPVGWVALRRLARWGAFRLLDARYRVTGRETARLRAARRIADRARRVGAALDPAPLACVALLLDQPPAVARRCLARLDPGGARAARIEAALAGARRLAGRFGERGRAHPREVEAASAGLDGIALAAAWLVADGIGRRRLARRLAAAPGSTPTASRNADFDFVGRAPIVILRTHAEPCRRSSTDSQRTGPHRGVDVLHPRAPAARPRPRVDLADRRAPEARRKRPDGKEKGEFR